MIFVFGLASSEFDLALVTEARERSRFGQILIAGASRDFFFFACSFNDSMGSTAGRVAQ